MILLAGLKERIKYRREEINQKNNSLYRDIKA